MFTFLRSQKTSLYGHVEEFEKPDQGRNFHEAPQFYPTQADRSGEKKICGSRRKAKDKYKILSLEILVEIVKEIMSWKRKWDDVSQKIHFCLQKI